MTTLRSAPAELLPVQDIGSAAVAGERTGSKAPDQAAATWNSSAAPIYVTLGGRMRLAKLIWRPRLPTITPGDVKLLALAAAMVAVAIASLSL